MQGIFISYRREDSEAHALHLYNRLTRQFGKNKVFKDTDSIRVGEDFLDRINNTLSSCTVMLVVIGKSWLEAMNRRLNDIEDYVRYEIKIAIDQQILIIPVLFDGTQMPRQIELPSDISALARRKAHEISYTRYKYDVSQLINELKKISHQPNISSNKLIVAGIEIVKQWGWDSVQLMDKLLSMDRDLMQGLTIEEEGTPEQWGPITWSYPETWRLLLTSPDQQGSIVGNWQFVPLFAGDYEAARRGDLKDNEISPDKVKPMFPGWYDVYFVAVFMLPEYRKAPYLHILVNSVLDHFAYLAQKEIYIDRICANAYTPEGEALCKYFEFNFLGLHSIHGKIYERTLYPFPPSPIFKDYKELDRSYQKATKARKK